MFGEDHLENCFLKKVLKFVISYVENNRILLSRNYNIIQQTINYCRPALELISDDIRETELKHIKYNPFYREYKNALQTGSYILKRFAYNITQTSEQRVTTPPFWIDMPRLFELYVFSKMIKHKGGAYYNTDDRITKISFHLKGRSNYHNTDFTKSLDENKKK